ncbi:MAG TPA: amidophosphoribosyltransferase [Thermotogota bacterium]|nr:amidophosphoribosyltransferase [Thermotogota bacterium]HPJ88958.1 amidophosphoribosyltransferase [Thermotogota bacterium]HPR95904.1 amidophosphoribosyltransferase [Thermotogota bacterium]
MCINNLVEIDKFQEECGVFGVYDTQLKAENTTIMTYYGLYALQHRGQESCGIAYTDGKSVECKKSMGLVSEGFSREKLDTMKGYGAIGHVRYSTKGASKIANAQPITVNYKLGTIAVAHNGTLVNADVLRDLLEDAGVIFQSTSDSEVLLSLIARSAKYGFKRAVTEAMQAVKGSFAIVILTEKGMIGARDPYGIRPLCIGKKDGMYFLSSESCAFDSVGAEFIRDVKPGEIVMISEEGIESIYEIELTKLATCSFEYIYFARPDSRIDGIDVYKTRELAGEVLARAHPVDADIVTGVPDSGIPAAVGYATYSGIPYKIGLIKNKYIGRTFIAPTQEMREHSVHVKMNALKANVEGKRVVLIDDSIVRGTTSKRLITLLKNAGATEVHLRISSPAVQFPCYFGIDTPYRSDLIAATQTKEETAKLIGADSLEYLEIPLLLEALGGKDEFCMGCFSGIYPVPTPVGE